MVSRCIVMSSMPQPDDRSAHPAADASRASDRYGPVLIPVLLQPGIDPLDGFSPEEPGPGDDPLDAFRPEVAPAERYRDLSPQPVPDLPLLAGGHAWHESPKTSRRLPAIVAGVLMLAAIAVGTVYLTKPAEVPVETAAALPVVSGADPSIAPAPVSAPPPVANLAVTASEPGAAPATPAALADPEPSGTAASDRAASGRAAADRAAISSDAATNSAATGTTDAAAPAAAGDEMARALPSRGQIQISSDPPGARVFLNGRSVGRTPLTLRRVVPAVHDIVVRRGPIVVTRSVEVTAGATTNVFVPLARSGAAPAAASAATEATGSLAVQSPVPLRILENGQTLGVSTDAPVNVAAGRHQLELVNDEIELRVPLIVEIVAGKPTQLSVPLPTGTLSLNATPWAEVFVDGRSLGLTPIANAQVSVGRHDLAWRHPQLGEKRSIIIVGAQTPVRASMDFNR
jgi:hypothetical protein